MNEVMIMEVMKQSVIKSAKDCFSTFCPMTLEVKETINHFVPDFMGQQFVLIGIVGFTGKISGSVSIHVKKDLARKVTQSLLGDEFGEAEITDTVGEVANIITGGAKTQASFDGIDFEITVPTVIEGNTSAKVVPNEESKNQMILFNIDDEPMLVLITVVTN
jgi:chemotaxis protein CheX